MRALTYADYYCTRASDFAPEDTIAVKIVAVIGFGRSWAAYAGLSTWTDEQVASEGDKIRQEAAEALFPTVAAAFHWRS
jgi:hypothetical protein